MKLILNPHSTAYYGMGECGNGNETSHHVSQYGLYVEVDEGVHPSSLRGLQWVGPVIKLQNEGALRISPVLQNLIRPYVQNLDPRVDDYVRAKKFLLK